ncbi:uncharacterized protein LOC132278452 [Cornus florida]|uniref:uncharacterized protein LOC132278452 n=1 Tax=Cornus florida TaxID=4283 RepID=UPI0028983FCC|nr:uncharacterized protein LOC132278452 [Cornus florida]
MAAVAVVWWHEKYMERYQNRKNFIATNVLGACSRDLKFVYVLPGWEGSAGDGKVHGYPLSPYEWSTSGSNPRTYKELFNLRHSIARNVIERAFGLLKKRWAILRTDSFLKLKTRVNIISACAILHNFIRIDKPNDPLLDEVEAELARQSGHGDDDVVHGDVDVEVGEEDIDVHGGTIPIANTDRIRTIRTTNEWTQIRDALAQAMFVEYQQRRGNL